MGTLESIDKEPSLFRKLALEDHVRVESVPFSEERAHLVFLDKEEVQSLSAELSLLGSLHDTRYGRLYYLRLRFVNWR